MIKLKIQFIRYLEYKYNQIKGILIHKCCILAMIWRLTYAVMRTMAYLTDIQQTVFENPPQRGKT